MTVIWEAVNAVLVATEGKTQLMISVSVLSRESERPTGVTIVKVSLRLC